MDDVVTRLGSVQDEIAAAAARSGRDMAEIELVAVSKTHPPEAIAEVLAAGHSLFGESRVQEARAKVAAVSGRARWHFIGHLQRNKIRHALPLFELFHSVDSLALAEDFQRIADEDGQPVRVLLEVNTAGESTKFGFSTEALRRDFEAILGLSRITVEGLMTIPPPVAESEDARPFFAGLRELRDDLEAEFHARLPTLSMGMSDDFGVAIEEGATLVRVGTAIFGKRSGKTWKPQAGADFD